MIIDIFAGIVILYGFYIGYKNGIIKTAFSTLSILLAIPITFKFSPIAMNLLENTFKFSDTTSYYIGIILTFFVALLGIQVLGGRIEALFKAAKINVINKFAGALLMASIFSICLGFLTQISSELRFITAEQKQSSISYPALVSLPAATKPAYEKLKPFFSEFWDKTMDAIDSAKEKVGNG